MTSRPRLVAGALALVLAVVAQAGEQADKKRRAPADVPPLVAGELRYEAPRMGTPFGYAQDGGVVVARRADSGDLVWTRRVYAVARDPHMEGDKQDVFIKSLALTADGKRLAVVNERGEHYEMDLDGSHLRAVP